MIPKQFQRDVSFAAWAGVRLAGFALTLFLLAGVLHRLGFLTTSHLLATLAVAGLAALVAVGLSAMGFHSLWKHGSVAGKRSVLALVLSSAVLVPFGLAAYRSTVRPHLSDISTDLSDPPLLIDTRQSGLDAAIQTAAYPEVSGRRYDITTDRVAPYVDKLIDEAGWKPVSRSAEGNQTGEILIEVDAKTLIFGFTDSVVIRVTDEGRTTFVDMRSRSDFGDNDLGANAARITAFLQALDLLVATGPVVQPGK